MKTTFLSTLSLFAMGSCLQAQDGGSALPFAVTLGGQAALVLIMLAFISLGGGRLKGQEQVAALPFGITIGGQIAVAEPDGNSARIGKPVRRDAVVSVNSAAHNIILNLSKTTPNEDLESTPPAVILLQGKCTSLERSIDGRDIEPGDYDLMVVADGRTASVKLTIE